MKQDPSVVLEKLKKKMEDTLTCYRNFSTPHAYILHGNTEYWLKQIRVLETPEPLELECEWEVGQDIPDLMLHDKTGHTICYFDRNPLFYIVQPGKLTPAILRDTALILESANQHGELPVVKKKEA